MCKSTINERFIFLVNYIISEKVAKNKAEIAQILDVKPSKFSEILNKRMNVGIDMIVNICSRFGISVEWVLTGNGDMLQKNVSQSIIGDNNMQAGKNINSQPNELFLAKIKLLEQRIVEQENQINEKDIQINKLLNILSNK